EKFDFNDIVVSIKSSNVKTMIDSYRMLDSMCDYPLHLGVTEAGTYRMGLIKSGLGIGSLLMDGIGDTLRVSLTDAPIKEIAAGFDILRAAGIKVAGPEIISCPTCGRTNLDVAAIANQVEMRLKGITKDIKIAVMGCAVNGPGEAKEADIGIACGIDNAVLFKKGKKVKTLKGDFIEEFIKDIYSFLEE
ncbi:MAG: flavodoxin-dependent (E)-4-hydroxy-3-methylbut-2-enyl-diphosphate synthase, partial [Oscillospiraceae bacterium]